MYMRFFGLKQEPFSLAPDPRYLYMSKRHREALGHLLYGVGGGGGFVLLSGEIGAGKTTVCRCFLEQIPKRCNVAYIFNPKLTVKETEHYIRHRLSVAGMTRGIPFDRKALQRIHEIARGVPRRINLLCDRVMLGAYAHGRQTIDVAMVEKAGREVFGRMPNSTPPDRAPSARGTGVGIVIGAG